MSAKKQESRDPIFEKNETADRNANTNEITIERNLFSVDLDFQPNSSARMQIQSEIEEQKDRLHRIWAGLGLRK